MFWHSETKALLTIYVDDFKLACRKQHAHKLWTALRERISLDEPTAPDRFLGCHLEEFEALAEDMHEILGIRPGQFGRGEVGEDGKTIKQTKPFPLRLPDPKRKVKGYKYNLQKYFEKAVDKYCHIAGITKDKLRKVQTPFIDESKLAQGFVEQDPGNGTGKPEPGVLQKPAASVVMTVLWVARYGRFDLLRAAGYLTQVDRGLRQNASPHDVLCLAFPRLQANRFRR